VFSFYSDQFAALVELVFNLTILALVRAAITAEEAREAEASPAVSAPAPAATVPLPGDSR
jgi:hypothetical protein